ncbi:MAG TPA: sulfite exporter TauE/SafE family protein [Blastocatellia bacterium]|nr:sulfite exporter TauE/SafE family protein [Blastocatellia bacterium]
MDLLAALTLGLFGSLHCIGMCGPLALALLPTNGTQAGFAQLLRGSLLYNGGRIVTYALLGFGFGLLGSAARVAGWQQALSIITGSVILLWLLLPKRLTQRMEAKHHAAAVLAHLKLGLNRLLRSHRWAAQFGVGVLNGLLPCGFVYLALAGALAQPSLARSVLFMALFGLGTTPALLAVALPNGWLSPTVRFSLRRVLPLGTAVVAVLLIVRGLALGVPYLSPKLTSTSAAHAAAPACHQP